MVADFVERNRVQVDLVIVDDIRRQELVIAHEPQDAKHIEEAYDDPKIMLINYFVFFHQKNLSGVIFVAVCL